MGIYEIQLQQWRDFRYATVIQYTCSTWVTSDLEANDIEFKRAGRFPEVVLTNLDVSDVLHFSKYANWID